MPGMGIRVFSAALGALIALACAAGPAAADVRDVRVAWLGDRAVLEIDFAAAPVTAAAAPAPGGLVLQITGGEAQGRWVPATRDVLTAVEARDGVLTLFTARDVIAARALVQGRTVRIELTLGAAIAPAEAVRAAAGAESTAPAPLAAVAADADDADDGAGGAADPRPAAAVTPGAHPDADTTDAPADVAPTAADPQGARVAALYAADLDDAACAAADEAVRDDPWDLQQVRLYGACLARDGEHVDAAAVFERLLTFQPDDPEALLGLAVARHRAGDLDGARESYETALAFAVTDAEAARIRALMDGL